MATPFYVDRIRLVAMLVACAVVAPVRAADSDGVWTIVNDTDPAAVYSPGIKAGMAGGFFCRDLHVTQQAGEWAAFSFIGTGVKWIGSTNGGHGDADVYLDGKFDATVKTTGPTWQKQQEIYVKTGLPYGPHTIKIVTKEPRYVDFDAFAFYGPRPRTAAMPGIEGVTLPSLQPLLGAVSRYPVGNGAVVALYGPTGQIKTVFGPGYTTSDLLDQEDVMMAVDGVELPLRVEMRRAAVTGVYYGTQSRGDLDVGVIDYACRGEPWISRLLVVKNTSMRATHTVVFRDSVLPHTEKGYTSALAVDAAGNPAGFTVQTDTSIGVPFGGNNPVDKSVVITFDDPAVSASLDGANASIRAGPIQLAPGAQHEISLTHYFRAGHDLPDAKVIAAIRAVPANTMLQKSITEWTDWIRDVPPAYALSNVKDERARVLMEGALVILKTNQSLDGGIIAHVTHYKEGYVRDAAMAVRGLLAMGHTNEARQWLVWIDREFSVHGHLGDAMSCSVSPGDKSNSFDMGDMEVEEPGWVLLCARDYYNETHDLGFLKGIDRTLRFCADVQLKQAAANGDRLPFNGDETEICGALNAQATNLWAAGSPAKNAWSLSSAAMAAASLDFYARYVRASGGDPSAYPNAQTNTTVDIPAEVKKLVAAMDRDFWRTDVPGMAGGFHDFFRAKADGAWPKAQIANFTLMPVFFGTPYAADEKAKDVAAMAQFFNPKTGFLPLVPAHDTGMEGHDLGYLLWDCVEVGDWHKEMVYQALVNGRTVDAWGAFNEAYDSEGEPNSNDLRSLETGVNITALAKYWGLGK